MRPIISFNVVPHESTATYIIDVRDADAPPRQGPVWSVTWTVVENTTVPTDELLGRIALALRLAENRVRAHHVESQLRKPRSMQ